MSNFMKYNYLASLLIFAAGVSLLFTSCLKEDSKCITQVGKPMYEEREVNGNFDSIYLDGDVNLHLTQDDKLRIYLHAGEKLLPGITTIQKGRTLRITDENKCDFLRDMGTPIDIYVTLNQLRYLNFRSSGTIQSSTPIISDSLTLECWGGGGSIKLEIDVMHCWIFQHGGNVDFAISGKADYNYIYWNSSYSPVDCSNLLTGYTYIIHKGANDATINVQNVLQAEIHSIGNIIYQGHPSEITIRSFGKGELIKKQ